MTTTSAAIRLRVGSLLPGRVDYVPLRASAVQIVAAEMELTS